MNADACRVVVKICATDFECISIKNLHKQTTEQIQYRKQRTKIVKRK